MQSPHISLQDAIANGKLTASSGKIRYNDLSEQVDPNVTVTPPPDNVQSIINSISSVVDDPMPVADAINNADSVEEVKEILNSNGVNTDEGGFDVESLMPYVLGGAAVIGGGMALKAALAKRKKVKPEIGGVKNELPKAIAGPKRQLRLPAPPKKLSETKQITTDLMSDDKAASELKRVISNQKSVKIPENFNDANPTETMTDLQRILMNMATTGRTKGKIK